MHWNAKACCFWTAPKKIPAPAWSSPHEVSRRLDLSLSLSRWRWARRCVYSRTQERSGDTSLLLSLSQWRQGSARAQSPGKRPALSWIEHFLCFSLFVFFSLKFTSNFWEKFDSTLFFFFYFFTVEYTSPYSNLNLASVEIYFLNACYWLNKLWTIQLCIELNLNLHFYFQIIHYTWITALSTISTNKENVDSHSYFNSSIFLIY